MFLLKTAATDAENNSMRALSLNQRSKDAAVLQNIEYKLMIKLRKAKKAADLVDDSLSVHYYQPIHTVALF